MTTHPRASSSLVTYQSSEIPEIWPYVEPLLKRAIDRQQPYGNYTIGDIYEGLKRADMQLWTAEGSGLEAAWVTSIQTKNGTTFCLLLACGGENLHAWKHFLRHVSEWAKEKGATELLIFGRYGWARVLDFDICYAVMRKPL